LHVRVDTLVEIPVFTGVLLSGPILSTQTHSGSTAFMTMVLCGLGAIITNLYCVWLVFQRRRACILADWNRFDRLDHLQHKFGALVLLFALAALIAGINGRG
jgi:hypothetical protein